MTRDCLLAHAPICDPRGRDRKYGSLSSVDSALTGPSMVTWRPSAYQGNSTQAHEFPARSVPLRDVRFV